MTPKGSREISRRQRMKDQNMSEEYSPLPPGMKVVVVHSSPLIAEGRTSLCVMRGKSVGKARATVMNTSMPSRRKVSYRLTAEDEVMAELVSQGKAYFALCLVDSVGRLKANVYSDINGNELEHRNLIRNCAMASTYLDDGGRDHKNDRFTATIFTFKVKGDVLTDDRVVPYRLSRGLTVQTIGQYPISVSEISEDFESFVRLKHKEIKEREDKGLERYNAMKAENPKLMAPMQTAHIFLSRRLKFKRLVAKGVRSSIATISAEELRHDLIREDREKVHQELEVTEVTTADANLPEAEVLEPVAETTSESAEPANPVLTPEQAQAIEARNKKAAKPKRNAKGQFAPQNSNEERLSA